MRLTAKQRQRERWVERFGSDVNGIFEERFFKLFGPEL
jgi:hypothetical protein